MYCFEVEDAEVRKRAKGIRKPVLCKFTFDDYCRSLFEAKAEKITQQHFRSIGHRVYTETVTKRGLCARDDKRFVYDVIETLPWSEATVYMHQVDVANKNK